MVRHTAFLNSFVAAFLLAAPSALADADDPELDALFAGLLSAEGGAVAQIEGRIYEIWSQSGSPAMDLLLSRGQEALAEGSTNVAIDHFTALIDHAPDFAEGYNGRATAWFRAGRYGPSLDDIAKTLELNPRHFGALSGLALILEELGHDAAALEAWREVEKIHPAREGLVDAIRRLSRSVEGQTL